MMKSAFLTLVLASAVVAGTAQSQDAVVGAKTEIVRLDAVVTDADGKLVRDLTQEDFALFENGKRQTLTHFQFVGAGRPAVPPEEAAAGAPGTTGAGGRGRYVVILVDDLHIARGDLTYTREALRRLAGDLLTDDDKVALLKTSSPPASYRFVQDRLALQEAIDGLSASDAVVPPALGGDMTPVMAELVLSGDRSALQLATRRLIDDPTSFVDTSGPRGSVAAARGVARAGIDPSENVAADEAQRQARGILLEALRFSAATLGALEDMVRGLAPLPGRKICLLVSDGFLVGEGTSLELTGAVRGIVDAATRSGTAVYALDSEGLPSTASDAGVAGGPSRPGLEQSVARQGEIAFRKTLETVSGGTGGFLIRGETDSLDGLRRMLEDSETHYVMAYEPTNTKRDGKFRKIELTLPHDEKYTVRSRQGYLAPDDRRDSADRRAGGTASLSLSDDAVRALLDVAPPDSGIPVHLSAGFLELPPLGSQALIRTNVDLRAVSFREADSRHRGTVEILGGIYDATGEPVGAPFVRQAQLDWADDEHEKGLRAGLAFEQAVPLDAGRYEIRLLVRDAHGVRRGGARQWVDVLDLSDKKLAMSAVFLGSAEQAAKGVRRFKRDEDLSFELYVYNPLVDASGESDVVLQAQIWSEGQTIAASQPEPVSFRETDGVPEPQGNSFPLAGLEPGPHELRIVVVDRKANVTISHATDFTVE